MIRFPYAYEILTGLSVLLMLTADWLGDVIGGYLESLL